MRNYQTFAAIDPGSRTGWALWRTDMKNPVYGTWKFEFGTDGQRFNGLQRKLHQLSTDYGGVDYLRIEFNRHVHMGERAVDLGYGWKHAVEMYAAAYRIPIRMVTTQQWRLDFVGRQEDSIIRAAAKAAKAVGEDFKIRDKLKAATIARCRQLGWAPTDDNQADALGQLDTQIKENQIQAPWYASETLLAPLGVVR